jgi:hypothetical protein
VRFWRVAFAKISRYHVGMKDFFIGLIVGAFLSGATVWYFTVARDYPQVKRTWRIVDAKLGAWHLHGDDIKDELARTGKIVRRQAREIGAAVAETSSDAAVTAKIKAKFVADRELSAMSISVNTTDGRVTLAGNVKSHDQIGRAMLLALETEGVREVVSTLQVKTN